MSEGGLPRRPSLAPRWLQAPWNVGEQRWSPGTLTGRLVLGCLSVPLQHVFSESETEFGTAIHSWFGSLARLDQI